MSLLQSPRRKVAAGAVAAIASLGAGVGAYALTAPTIATAASNAAPLNLAVSTQSSSAAHIPKVKRHLTLLQRSDHTTIEVKVKGQWKTFEYDRGKVTAASPSSVTLALPDGKSVTEAITSSTKFGGVSGASSLRDNVRAFVVSSGGTALRIHQAPPKTTTPATPAAPAA